MLVDAGAEVVKAEPAGGDDLRRWTASHTDLKGADGALLQYLAAGKRSVVAGGVNTPEIGELLAGVDLLVESGTVGDEDLAALRAAHPGLDILSLTPFGRTGPWRDRPWTEFTLQAQAGSTGGRGYRDRPPMRAGGRLGEWMGGTYAGAVALALRTAARRRGQGGEHADVSLLECVCLTMSLYAPLTAALSGTRPRHRTVEIPSVERAADGWVGLCTITGQMFGHHRPGTAPGAGRRVPEGHRGVDGHPYRSRD
ncbi:CoA transferase [Streptomyces sp. NPDC055681]